MSKLRRGILKAAFSVAALSTAAAAIGAFSEDPAIARTRQQALMLDDLYKTSVVLITEHYVKDPSTLSAASAAKALFEAMKQKGWHEARLVGFNNTLFNPENQPKDDFEQTAQSKLMAGEAHYERTIKEADGKRYLYFATPVPVVMEKCVMCHADFKDETGPIGALSYKIPVIE